jgi:integrase
MTDRKKELCRIDLMGWTAPRYFYASASSGLALIAQADGSPLVKESFGTWFRLAIIGAGLSGISAHGLRKFAATRAAENGATVAELESLFGWRGGSMASLYTNSANRAKLAKGAASKMLDEEQKSTLCPHLAGQASSP